MRLRARFAHRTSRFFSPGVPPEGIATASSSSDARWELDETFAIRLSRPRNASIADALGIGTILNDEGGGCSPSNPCTNPDPNPPGDGF